MQNVIPRREGYLETAFSISRKLQYLPAGGVKDGQGSLVCFIRARIVYLHYRTGRPDEHLALDPGIGRNLWRARNHQEKKGRENKTFSDHLISRLPDCLVT